MIRFICPICWSVSEVSDDMEGNQVQCPECHALGTAVKSDQAKITQGSKSARYRFGRRILRLSILVGIAVVGYFVYNFASKRWEAEKEVREALAKSWPEIQLYIRQTDEKDPGWRLEDLITEFPEIPDEKNAWTFIQLAGDSLPKDWKEPDFIGRNPDIVPPRRITKDDAEELRRALKTLQPALEKSRLAGLQTQGKCRLTYSADVFSTDSVHLIQARQVRELLALDEILSNYDGDHSRALESCKGIVNLARSLGEPPSILLQVTRIAFQSEAIRGIERTLAHSQLTQEDLQQLQTLLEEEARFPLLLSGLRGDRAGFFRQFTAMKEGTAGKPGQPESSRGRALFIQHFPAVLSGFNKMITVAKTVPIHLQAKELESLTEKDPFRPGYADRILSAASKCFRANQRSQATLRCAIVGLAVERYRLNHGNWPHDLQELVADKLIKEVPTDPYDGEPIRYRQTEDGVVVFSAGMGGMYQGDCRDEPEFWLLNYEELAHEFRLWNVARRFQKRAP